MTAACVQDSGLPWLTSVDTMFHQNNTEFSVSGSSLSLASNKWVSGEDRLGNYTGLQQVTSAL